MKDLYKYAILAVTLGIIVVGLPIFISAWMEPLTFTFMQTEQMSITSMTYPSADTIYLTVKNTGTGKVIIADVTVNGDSASFTTDMTTNSWEAGDIGHVTITFDWISGNTYRVLLQSSTGKNVASYQKVA